MKFISVSSDNFHLHAFALPTCWEVVAVKNLTFAIPVVLHRAPPIPSVGAVSFGTAVTAAEHLQSEFRWYMSAGILLAYGPSV